MENLIIVDTREKGHKKILEYFDEINQKYLISKLDAGDYMIFDNYETIIDRKDGLIEINSNLTRDHDRLVREVDKAHELGCKDFIFLIAQNNIKTEDDIKKWRHKFTKVPGHVLLKRMKTFGEHHNCRFVVVPRNEIGSKIIEILTKRN